MPTIALATAFNSIQQNNQHPKIMSINTVRVDLMRLHFICIARRLLHPSTIGLRLSSLSFWFVSLECKQIDSANCFFSTVH